MNAAVIKVKKSTSLSFNSLITETDFQYKGNSKIKSSLTGLHGTVSSINTCDGNYRHFHSEIRLLMAIINGSFRVVNVKCDPGIIEYCYVKFVVTTDRFVCSWNEDVLVSFDCIVPVLFACIVVKCELSLFYDRIQNM